MQFYLQNMDTLTVRFNLSISIFVVDDRKQYWIILIKIFFKSPQFDFQYFSALFIDTSFNSIFSVQHNVSEKCDCYESNTQKRNPLPLMVVEGWIFLGLGFIQLFPPKGTRLFFFYILIQNCLRKFDLDRETSSAWDGATLKYVQR